MIVPEMVTFVERSAAMLVVDNVPEVISSGGDFVVSVIVMVGETTGSS